VADPNLCERCGRCCCQKMIIDDEIVYLPIFCRYFDKETRLCTIYDQRYEANPRCLTVEEGIEIGVFPAGCPYVRDRKGYRPPREVSTEDEVDIYLEAQDDD
jgi:uncharacterized protein